MEAVEKCVHDCDKNRDGIISREEMTTWLVLFMKEQKDMLEIEQ